jgi:protocatechuate 3,4-dioxygenase alpha subunit
MTIPEWDPDFEWDIVLRARTQRRWSSEMPGITPSQTVGPFYAYCLTPAKYKLREIFTNDLIVPGLEGEKIRIEGRVLDGDNIGIPDAMVEIWQADAKGGFAHARDSRARIPASKVSAGSSRTMKASTTSSRSSPAA